VDETMRATKRNARRLRHDAGRLTRQLWRKLRGVAAQIPFAEDALAVYYCSLDRATPLRVRASILGALIYFVTPADAMPDLLPALGFTDDAAVIAATLQLVAAYVRPEHREAGRRALAALGGQPQT
jgi:uncharacterized membrane protein YkvA (DUF1232 family)